MVRLKQFLEKYLFFIAFPAAFLVIDLVLSAVIPPYIVSSGRFKLNDYEVTRRDHPEEVWDKVFFGSSEVISGYREDISESGYINLGLDCGVITDLLEMLRRGTITVGSELLVGMTDLTLYDGLAADPGYPWHRAFYEPYCYFARDRLQTLFKETGKQLLTGFKPAYAAYTNQTKGHYYGSVSYEALYEKVTTWKYASLPIEDFQKNLRALSELADYCETHGIRLRTVWLPMNPQAPIADITFQVRDAAKALCAKKGVEFLDMSDALDADCFYDSSHLNYEYGSYRFTEAIDPWLAS